MSNKDNTNDLIDNLCGEHKPVKCMMHPLWRIIPWILAIAVYTGCAIYFIGLRHDIETIFQTPGVAFEIILMGLTGILAALTSSYLSVPDMRGHKWLIPTTITALAIFALWCCIRGAIEGMFLPRLHLDHCMGEGAFLAIIPVAILLFMMKQGTTTKPVLMGIMNVISISAAGYVALRFTCSMDTVGHATLSHIVPYILFGAAIGVVARKLYKW